MQEQSYDRYNPPTVEQERQEAADTPAKKPNGGAPTEGEETRVIEAIAHLSTFEYAKQRRAIAEKEGVRAQDLDALRKSIEQGAGPGHAGEPVEFEDIEPWPEPVDGSAVAQEVEGILRERVILSDDAYIAAVLWVMHAHAHDAADHSPILLVTSPTRGCGKSLLLDVIEPMVPRALLSVNSSAPALYRSAHLLPTVLVDEGDTFLADDGQMVGFFNGGHRRGTGFIRCEGEDNQPRKFPAWCPKALAQIGMPRHATITDRSVVISMRKKAPGERIAFYSRKRHGAQLAETGRRLARWAQDHEPALREAEPTWPSWLDPGSRAWDNWRPLCAIADSLGGEWGERARIAARALQPPLKDSNEELLADLRTIMEPDLGGFWASETLIEELIAMEERDYGRLRRGDKPITDRWLASRLHQFGIESERGRAGDDHTQRRGYYAAHFHDAWKRWTPPSADDPEEEKPLPGADSAVTSVTPSQKEAERCDTVTLVTEESAAGIEKEPSWEPNSLPTADSGVTSVTPSQPAEALAAVEQAFGNGGSRVIETRDLRASASVPISDPAIPDESEPSLTETPFGRLEGEEVF